MNAERDDFSGPDIERIVDCRLDACERDTANAFLAAHPEAAEMVDAHRHLNARLRAHYDPVLAEAVPGTLIRTAMQGANRVTVPRRRFALAAALAGVMFAAFAAGAWLWWQQATPPAYERVFAEQAAEAHRLYAGESIHAVEIGAASADELVAWISQRLAMPSLRAPVLASAGLRLVGGRLLPADDAAAGQLMYEQPDGERVTLYLRGNIPARGEVEFRYADEAGVAVLYWIDGPRGYALAGTLDRDRLRGIAQLVYDQLGS